MYKLFLATLLFSLLIGLYSIKIHRNEKNNNQNYIFLDYQNKVVVFDQNYIHQQSQIGVFNYSTNQSLFNPTEAEIKKALTILTNCTEIIDNKINTSSYVKQVYGLDENNKIVYIIGAENSIANPLDWKNNLIFVLDGGQSYFQTKINLNDNRCVNFRFNGEA